ncbi:hypothetical protein MSG28_008865 [Choristoneura fumiferana]|uniref:Uncharacterized protein n=1 Tax=Choristoneura fumiferana TaxID=7141 RepID=A0ACC0J889_CHOFU|nr:hypothetical protein MSG28_008865 [Choristoneura fumiferana]
MPARHTQPAPTDAYGTYVRLAHDTRSELIVQLLTREWALDRPKLLITIQGGKANFDLQPKLKKVLRKGLLKAAKTTGAWIFTGGTNTGVTRQVGDALQLERSQRAGRVVSIGIAPWGIVEGAHELIGRGRDVPSKLAVLNNRHAYFLLVDNGSVGRYGAEIVLRRKLEKYIAAQKLHPCSQRALDEAMMQALEHDRIDFVKLLLENGVSMRKFLTIPRLEELYNTKSGPGNTLQYILRDVRPHLPRGYIYTLHDIGLVINKLMGGAYSLVACKLYKAMAHEAAEDDMETEDDDQAQQLLTCELQNWSGQTCLSLAVAANHRALLAHPCSQIILADLWMGGLRTRKNTSLKVILSLLCPLYILYLEFKSKEELQLMPQTEEEHLENESMEDDRSTKDPNDAEIAYILFLLMFTYTVLVKMSHTPSWPEIYSICYIITFLCEKVREIVTSEPVAIRHKFSVWAWNMWNTYDAGFIIFFLVGLTLRLRISSMDVGRVIYCVDIIYWYLRILNILGVNKYLGPLVTMMGKMVKNMIYFVVLLLVVLMSFGVARQAILYPDKEASWYLIREVFFQPYFMLYGEVFAEQMAPPCGKPGLEECRVGHWVPPVVMSVYLLIANILLVNLLIAVFNNIFIEVNGVSHQVWMFQRFTVVMEYERKPVLPPPIIIFCHIYATCKWVTRNVSHQRFQYDNGLKLFLEKEDMERLYDFEEECVEGYFREQEVKLSNSMEERVRNTTDRVEHITTKMEDLNQKANCQIQSVQSVEFRLRKLEDVAEQTMNHLAVIHRFMATHPSLVNRGSTDTLGPPPPTFQAAAARLRTTSDRSEVLSDSDTGAARFAVRPVQEEDEQSQPSDLTPKSPVHQDEMPQSGPEIPMPGEKEADADSSSTSSGGSAARAEITVIRTQPPVITARQRSSESNRTEPSEDKKVPSIIDDAFLEANEPPSDLASLRPRTTSAGTRRTANTRRRSEGGNDCGMGGHYSTQHLAPRRQHSQTHSEPDNSAVDAGSDTNPSISITFTCQSRVALRAPSSCERNVKP